MKAAALIAWLWTILFMAGAAVQAQTPGNFYDQPYKERNNGAFGKGTQIVSLGYALGNVSGTGYLNINLNEKVSHANLGPLYVKYEYGLIDEIGLGGYVSYAYAKDVMNRAAPKEYYTNAFSIGFNAFYHFNKLIHVENLDLYAGLGLGYKNVSIRGAAGSDLDAVISPTLKENTGLFSLRLGARYYIINGFGAYFELGPDKMSVLNVGLSYRW